MASTLPPDDRTGDTTYRPARRSGRGSGGGTSRRATRLWIIAGVVGLVLIVAFVAVALYTDQPQFCGTCHEMRPYVAAWAAGKHHDVWCIDCHVGKGLPARFAHKIVALQEVVAHFSGDTSFPRANAPSVPNSRCLACHPNVVVTNPKGFDHALHASKGPCVACHSTVGHVVSDSSLQSAGVFNPKVKQVPFSTPFATIGGGVADLPGHPLVPCTRCHDLKKTGCPTCHKPPHKPRGNCAICHKPGPSWVFTHPTNAACQNCHTYSAKHFRPAARPLTPCTDCHKQPGKAWTFTHPAPTANCKSCHALPAKHFKPANGNLPPCMSCHKQAGKNWSFSHPGSGADCRSCHNPPANHPSGQCSNCHHNTGKSFAFSHPGTPAPHGIGGIACNRCHPSGFTDYSCTCHGGGHKGGD